MAWLLLGLAGLFEIGFTTCLRYTEGFRNLPWTLGFLGCGIVSFGLLERASKIIPLGTAYAVWVGIGAVGTVLVGVFVGGEPLGWTRGLLLIGLLACIVGLRLAH